MNIEQISIDELMLKRKSLRRQLSAVEGLQPVRIAILGGSTTNEVADLLEIFLLASGFQPVFHQSEYGRYYEDAVLDPSDLIEFGPAIVYVHTSCLNVQSFPPVHCSEQEFHQHVEAEVGHYRQIWESIERNLSAQIIQNNFELPPVAVLGNLTLSPWEERHASFLPSMRSLPAPRQGIQGCSSRIFTASRPGSASITGLIGTGTSVTRSS